MPPPPPNFLPAAARRNRRHLDPTRHLQSRELWNKVRFHESTDTNSDNNSTSSWLYYKALTQAILYEIQPFQIKPCYNRLVTFLREEDGLRQVFNSTVSKAISILCSVLSICQFFYKLFRQYCTIESMKRHKRVIGKVILILVGLKLYHRTLIYLHDLLHAGPILIILTLSTLLYTIGLGDNTGASSGVPSAYSVFNRGMRRILGTVDAEELARQYAGGAAVAVGGGRRVDRRDDDDGIWFPNHDDDNGRDQNDDENRLRNERRRQRRLERLQRRNNQADETNENGNNDENIDEPLNNNVGEGRNINVQNDEGAQINYDPAEANNRGGRKSGKKARRRNLELRREMQRQRQVATANGFGRGNGDDDAAMDRLIGDFAD